MSKKEDKEPYLTMRRNEITYSVKYVGDGKCIGKSYVTCGNLGTIQLSGKVHAIRAERDLPTSMFYIGVIYSGVAVVHAFKIIDGVIHEDPLYAELTKLLLSNKNLTQGMGVTSEAVYAYDASSGGGIIRGIVCVDDDPPTFKITLHNGKSFFFTKEESIKESCIEPALVSIEPPKKKTIAVVDETHTSKFIKSEVVTTEPIVLPAWYEELCTELESKYGEITSPLFMYTVKGVCFIYYDNLSITLPEGNDTGKFISISGIVTNCVVLNKITYYQYIDENDKSQFISSDLKLEVIYGEDKANQLYSLKCVDDKVLFTYKPLDVHFILKEICHGPSNSVYMISEGNINITKIEQHAVTMTTAGIPVYTEKIN